MIRDAGFAVPSFTVPVIAAPDVCVVGGGAAGVAAAVGAARCGMSVLLIERYGFCGGATVAGLSGTICGLYSSGERPEQIVFGFAGEFCDRLRARGGVASSVPFGRTRLLPHDSFTWKETADSLLAAAGVEVLFHTNFVRAYTGDAGEVRTLLLRAMEGLVAVQPRAVVDASGDAEVVAGAGLPATFGKDGVVQTPTMVFRAGGVDMPVFLGLDPREINMRVARAHAAGKYDLPRHHVYLFPMPMGREVLCNMTRITYPDGSVPCGISSAGISFAEQEGRRQARRYASFLKECVPGFENSYLVETGAQVGIRQSRSIAARLRLSNQDVLEGRKHPGAATFSAWPIECHSSAGLTISYLEGDAYDIPFETLIPAGSINLLAAGRCLCAEHEALASARVTAQCFGMGYAAGAACGLMRKENLKADALTGEMVAYWMRRNGLKTTGEAE
ncbi:MAG TPA: FAD-dependent oxidoreductase [Bryobacteraceae bacterium]|nr:FAD-dependent oxidoreductase [Bryobacteraceae bacterium]